MAIEIGQSIIDSVIENLGLLSYLGNTTYQIVKQEQCTMEYAKNLISKNRGSNKVYQVYPSLISPYEFVTRAVKLDVGNMRSYYNDISHIIRHGILVKTTKGERTFLAFIGGYDKGWTNSIFSIKIYNGGNAYRTKFSSKLAPRIFNSNTGLIVIPTTNKGPDDWVNFRNPIQEVCQQQLFQQGEQLFIDSMLQSVWQNAIGEISQSFQTFSKNINVVYFAGIMNYILQIQVFLFLNFMKYSVPTDSVIVYNETAKYWNLDSDIQGSLEGISSMTPSMTPGFQLARKLEDVFNLPTLITFPNIPSTLNYVTTLSLSSAIDSFNRVVQEGYKLDNFPIIVGAPVLGSMICSNDCNNSQGLIGFLSDNLLPELPVPSAWQKFQSKYDILIPPPRSYNWDDILVWAQTQGMDISALSTAVDAIAIIQDAVRKVAQEIGATEEELGDIAKDIEIGPEVIERGTENIATDIYNMIKGFL
ncbi:hypothetical protein [Acidianus manzaensis]|uniref:Uncharacterized protein n=1 Tax=Acidianus manzaensis TaxID=282676 RepID=A0A1W6K0E3_9CREN|nr:hypothetical protein [Acidianus manzaensis]ARM76003.1 hypothetical protein B6F84_08170 [Acidianus manzaensis]